ncbi:MAG: hypothetical protein ACXWZ2_16125 [Mycobacterium sp.]
MRIRPSEQQRGGTTIGTPFTDDAHKTQTTEATSNSNATAKTTIAAYQRSPPAGDNYVRSMANAPMAGGAARWHHGLAQAGRWRTSPVATMMETVYDKAPLDTSRLMAGVGISKFHPVDIASGRAPDGWEPLLCT